MKKKLLLLLIIPILLFGFNEKVVAEGVKTGKLRLTNPVFNSSFTFTSTGVLNGKKSHFYHMKLDTSDSVYLCYGLTKAANSGNVYYDTGVIVNDTMIRQAYAYYANNSGSLERFIIAQVVVWSRQFGANIGIDIEDSNNFLGQVDEALRKYDKNLSEEQINGLLNELILTEPYGETLTIWENITNRNGQPIIGPGDDNKFACPDGTKEPEMTACVSDKLKAMVDEATAISECEKLYCTLDNNEWYKLIREGTPPVCEDNNHTQSAVYKERMQKGGNDGNRFGVYDNTVPISEHKYCQLYCLETASQIFPGGIANAISVGTIFIWPTSENYRLSASHDIYPIHYSGVRTCTMVIAGTKFPDGSTDAWLSGVENPVDKFNSAYEDVSGKYNKYETSYNVTSTSYPDLSYTSAVKTWDFIRGISAGGTDANCNYGNNPENNSCNNYYSSKITAINNKISAANDKLDDQTCYTSSSSTINATLGDDGTYSCSSGTLNADGTTCTVTTTSETTCTWTSPEVPQALKDAKAALDNALNIINQNIETCNNYVDKYKVMAETYKEIAMCNNHNFDNDDDKGKLYNFKTDTQIGVSIYPNKGAPYSYIDLEKKSEIECLEGCDTSPWSESAPDDCTSLNQILTFVGNYNKIKFENFVNTLGGNISNRQFKLNALVDYEMPSSATLPTVDKGNGNYCESPLKRGWKVPLDSDVGEYQLNLLNNMLGHKGVFKDLIAASSDQGYYYCHYKVTYNPSDECTCPPGTKFAGTNLSSYLNGMTCYEAQKAYCDTDLPTEVVDVYCPPPYQDIKITDCLGLGYSYQKCLDDLCKDKVKENVCTCPDGTMPDTVSSCHRTKILQGLNYNEACNECQSLCSLTKGLRIIYRTISLANPFPGKTISSNIPGFNNDVNGRYPGTNWNDKNLVKEHIRFSRDNSRDTNNSDIYNADEPLYVFELNGTTINAIRSYNDSHKYDDFTLDCQIDNSVACVSKNFVHASEYGLTGGKCFSATSKNDFYTCSDD